MGIFRRFREFEDRTGGKTIIARGCQLSGEITELDGDLHTDGIIKGLVTSDFDFSVGLTGKVYGLVKAKHVVVTGLLEGRVACETFELLSTGELRGEVICQAFHLEEGAQFSGELYQMNEEGEVETLPERFEKLKNDPLLAFAGLKLIETE